jgi:hypothetical protein
MKNDYKDIKFQKLLNKLQQESWQLELLISGFAIFGLISSLEPIIKGVNESIILGSYNKHLFRLSLISCYVLIINLIIHVFLRGVWIGAIGLRYVSGDIDYDSLKYSKRFTNYLKNKVGSFDRYISTLENYCSVMFAITFLFLFYIISIFMILAVIILIAGSFFIESGWFSEAIGFMLLGIFAIFFLFLSLFVFIDFITQGGLKKKEWTSFLYFPLYKIFSIITLSFLYRPLVYNFLDNKFGKRLILILVPIYAFAFYISTIDNVRSNYLTKSIYSSATFSKTNNYLNSLEKNHFINTASIQSKVITDSYIKLFIPFRKKIEDNIIDQNEHLKPLEDLTGFNSNFFNKKEERDTKKDSLQHLYLKAFAKLYTIKIDNIHLNPNYIIAEINKQLGFETVISLKNIHEGQHLLKIDYSHFKRKGFFSNDKKTILNDTFVEIPFWYYKQ